MPEAVKGIEPGGVLTVVRMIYGFIRPWLGEQAKLSQTPIDDWMLSLLDSLLGYEAPTA